MHFLKHILLYILLPLLVLTIVTSYYRFAILHDYTVSYEGVCDPELFSCFTGCEDDECTSIYYYSSIERDAASLAALCGDDISDCDAANSCLSDGDCRITYCDPNVDIGLCDTIELDEGTHSLLDIELSNEPEENNDAAANITI
jgi:hypothetical protein